MGKLISSDELSKVWTQTNEDKTVFSVICSLVQGIFCMINMIFGYFILIHHFNQLLTNKSILIILIFTLFGEIVTSILSAILMVLVRLILGIRSSTYFLSIISLLSTLLQSIFYYSCFVTSAIVLYIWYFQLQPNTNDFLFNFVINKNISQNLIRDLLIYFLIEAAISLVEVIFSLPVIFNIIDYGLSKEINKIKGKPIVEFYTVNQPVTYTKYQNYEKAFESLNIQQNKSESHYVEV
ncbi:transmembrane domain-containing protein [Cryptosporidium canis]|uniref:Transmembrane domain-containing protein n=1 Tax=Cryptosporidium canis TaxID=195482 RepID=A0A9D5DDS6_9CRYT|nr:transmembrane domain-containing protein [Cryptosporidium canis]